MPVSTRSLLWLSAAALATAADSAVLSTFTMTLTVSYPSYFRTVHPTTIGKVSTDVLSIGIVTEPVTETFTITATDERDASLSLGNISNQLRLSTPTAFTTALLRSSTTGVGAGPTTTASDPGKTGAAPRMGVNGLGAAVAVGVGAVAGAALMAM